MRTQKEIQQNIPCLALFSAAILAAAPTAAEEFNLLTGKDAERYPGTGRTVFPVPGPGFPGTFYDGQRLAGTPGVGPTVTWLGSGEPLYPPNHVGAFSFYFRRASIPAGGANRVPLMGIDFLGGPLLDLDGDLNNETRSLVPVFGETPVEIPGTSSHVALTFDHAEGTVTLTAFDATGTNEGGPDLNPGVATTVNILADGALNGEEPGPVNPDFDTRVGSVAPFTGTYGDLRSVWRIEGIQAEFWYDSVDPFSSTAAELGTFQNFVRLNGWLVRRDPCSGAFPTLAGQGLGGTTWPTIDMEAVGQTYNRAFEGGFGPTATISDGNSSDRYSLGGSHGIALSDFGGDLGAYLDAVVLPHLEPDASAFVYLESAAFGINNSGDPVFGNTNGWDKVIVAESTAPFEPAGDVNGDGFVNAADAAALAAALLDPGALTPEQFERADVNGDGRVNGEDIQALVNCLF
jgi:hypothetical protein